MSRRGGGMSSRLVVATTWATLLLFGVFVPLAESVPRAVAQGNQAPAGQGKLEFPSDAVRKFNVALDAKLSADAANLRSVWGYRFQVGAEVRDSVNGTGSVTRVNARGDTTVSFPNGTAQVFAGGGSLQPVAGETRFGFTTDDGTAVSPTTVKGLLQTREIYVAQMNAFADYLETIPKMTRQQRVDMAERLSEKALEIARVYGPMTDLRDTARAARQQAPWNGLSEKNRYDSDMREAARLEAAGDKAGADEIRAGLRERNEWGRYLELRKQYFALLDQNPILGLRHSTVSTGSDDPVYLWEMLGAKTGIMGDPTYRSFASRFANAPGVEGIDFIRCDGETCLQLRVAEGTVGEFEDAVPRTVGGASVIVTDSGDPIPADWLVLTDFINTSAAETRRLANEAAGTTNFEDIWQFGTERYGAQHRAGAKLAQVTGSELIGQLVADARWNVSGSEMLADVDDAVTDVTLNGLAAVSLLIPFVGPFIAAGIGGVQIFRDGSDLYAVYGELDSASSTGAVTGFQYVGKLEDEVGAAETKLFVSVAAGSFDLLDAAFTGLKLLRTARATNLTPGVPPLLARPGGPDAPPTAGVTRTGDNAVAGAMPDDLILPNGVRANVSELDEATAAGVLNRIDVEELGRFKRFDDTGPPGDARFFTENGLFPTTVVETGGRRFYLSRPYQGPGGRVSVVAFEETPLGTVVPRSFYLSGEHGIWRAATGYGWMITKGPSRYVQAGGEGGFEMINKAAADLGVELQGPLGRLLQREGVIDLPKPVADRAFKSHLEAVWMGKDGDEFARWVNQPDVDLPLPAGAVGPANTVAPNGALAPDLAAGKLDSWTYPHPLYGNVEASVYRSADGSTLHLVLRDQQGRVFVPSIQNADAGLTPFGTRWSAHQPGRWNSTPLGKEDMFGNVPGPQAPGLPSGYYLDQNFRNAFNDQFGGILDDFNPLGSLDGIPPPAVRPAATARGANTTAGTSAGLPSTGGRTLATTTGASLDAANVATRMGGGATNSANALMEATDIKIREVKELLVRRRLPPTAAGLAGLLDAIPAELRGGQYDNLKKLHDQLVALEKKKAELSDRAAATTNAGAVGPGTAGAGGDAPPTTPVEGPGATGTQVSPANSSSGGDAIVPGNPDPSGGATEPTESIGLGGPYDSTNVVPSIDYAFTPATDEDDDDSRLDLSATTNISLGSDLNFVSGAVDLTVQKMVIEIRTQDGGPLVIAPSSSQEVAVVAPPGRSSGRRLNRAPASADSSGDNVAGRRLDPMAGLRSTVFGRGAASTTLMATPAANVLSWTSPRPPAPQAQQAVQVFLQNIGSSTGEAFVARVFNHTNVPMSLEPGALLIEPLQEQAQQLLQQQLDRLGDLNPMQFDLRAYCMEFLKLPPLADSAFQIAVDELQGQLGPVSDILDASRRLMDAGSLVPDSDPMAYFDSIRQWSIWTQEQGFDLSGFAGAFVEHTRKQLEAAGRPWDDAFEGVLRTAAGNRWSDIQQVLDLAEQISQEVPDVAPAASR